MPPCALKRSKRSRDKSSSPRAPCSRSSRGVVSSPALFDETPFVVTRAPEHGEHTELALIEAGYDWDQLAAMKESGAIL